MDVIKIKIPIFDIDVYNVIYSEDCDMDLDYYFNWLEEEPRKEIIEKIKEYDENSSKLKEFQTYFIDSSIIILWSNASNMLELFGNICSVSSITASHINSYYPLDMQINSLLTGYISKELATKVFKVII
jgi:hypothetical protein